MKKIILGVILASMFLMFSCNNVSEIENNKLLFDFDWKFALGDYPEAYKTNFNDSGWRTLNLPHDYSIEQPFDSLSPSAGGGGYAFGGIGWYRKNFTLNKKSENKKVVILFDGVYRNSEVWINGKTMGIRPYGYSSFSYDLTPYLNATGEENTLAVKVDTKEQMNSRWYTGAGIYRHVWLITTDKVHFNQWGVFAKTEKADNDNALLNIDIELINEYNITKDCEIISSLIDSNGKKVGNSSSDINIQANDSIKLSQQLSVNNPTLWSIENPYLYKLLVEVKANGEILDSYSTPFGVRTFRFDPDKGFFLNGEHVKLKGTNNHHAGGPLGSAAMDYTYERQLKILKEMGSNALRMSHNPPSPELLNAADKLGFVVIDEIFDEWEVGKTEFGYSPHFYEWYERDVKNWIKRDRNHPSVIAWSIGNEVREQWDSIKGPEIGKLILAAARKYDTSRPFTIGADGVPGLNSSGLGEMLELVGYNYQESMYEEDHKKFPNRVIYGSETVMYPYHPGNCFQMHTYNEWLATLQKDYIAGEFIWTGFDYLGEAGIGEVIKECDKPLYWPGWPSRGARSGLVDICGFEKPSYYFRKAIWNNEPMVYIAVETAPSAKDWTSSSFWSWPKVDHHWNNQTEGDTLAVHVYTNVPDVELKLNGQSLGSKHWNINEEAFLIWNVPYKKGVLEAIGKLPDGKIVTNKVETASHPYKIQLVPDRKSIKANKQDLCYVKVFLLDENDIPVPFADNEIEFELIGAGKLNAVGNGDLRSNMFYKSNKTKAFKGKCLAIIQSSDKVGEIILKAHGDGLVDSQITINSN